MGFKNKSILMSAIRKSKFHWDREITDVDVEDLADSIERTGQIAPVIVRPIGTAKKYFELLAGERRYLAQKKLGSERIPCRIFTGDDIAAEILSLVENLKIKKPHSKEWSAAAKRLQELYMLEEERKIKKEKPKNSKKKGQLLGTVPNNSTAGRKPSAKRRATKKVAKTMGVSESTASRAIKREENLIHSASKALDRGNITVHQADRLAGMSVSKQRVQLPIMIKETREQTRRRIEKERAEESGEMTAYAERVIGVICDDAANIREKVNSIMEYMPDKNLDYDTIMKGVDLDMLGEAGQGLLDLVDFLGQ
jgi:ParB/RepB/Spo0J family partition protein